MLTFLIVTFKQVPHFGINGMTSLSKTGAIMHTFKPQLLLEGAFNGNLLCQFVQMGYAKQPKKPIFDLGGGALVV